MMQLEDALSAYPLVQERQTEELLQVGHLLGQLKQLDPLRYWPAGHVPP